MGNLSAFGQFVPKIAEIKRGYDGVKYTRVSDQKQEDNTSLESQHKNCTLFAESNNINIVASFGGKHESAKTDERKEFQKMLAFVKRHKNVRYIIVNHYDRFSRSGASGIQIAEQLQKEYGVFVLSASQGIDPTTVVGQFVRNMLLMVGNMENLGRIERTTTAMRELLQKGYTPYSIPKGYVNLNKGSRAVDQQIVLNEQGKLIRKAFLLKAEKGMRNCEILERLNPLGLKLDDRGLCKVFKNPYYCGVLVSKFLPDEPIIGKHEAAVSQEIFLKVNNIVAEARNHPVSHREEDENLPLKRFTCCSECNAPLTGYIVRHRSGKSSQWYYKCRTKGCNMTKSAKQLHELFSIILQSFQINESEVELMKIGIAEMYSEIFTEAQENQKHCKTKISELQKKIETAQENLVTGVIDRPMYDKFSAKFQTEITAIEKEMVNFEHGSSNLEKCLNKVIEFCRKPLLWWQNAKVGEKMILQNLIFPEGIQYDRKNDVVLTHRINSFFAPIPQLAGVLRGNKKGGSQQFSDFPLRVTPEGF